jgi:hypothetical protein
VLVAVSVEHVENGVAENEGTCEVVAPLFVVRNDIRDLMCEANKPEQASMINPVHEDKGISGFFKNRPIFNDIIQVKIGKATRVVEHGGILVGRPYIHQLRW